MHVCYACMNVDESEHMGGKKRVYRTMVKNIDSGARLTWL